MLAILREYLYKNTTLSNYSTVASDLLTACEKAGMVPPTSTDPVLFGKKNVWEPETKRTFCKDCGVETDPGVGSVRCSDCWDGKCGAW